MRAEDITDEESLCAWLETRPRADAVAIAHRAAMRVFPLWVAAIHLEPKEEVDELEIRHLRALITNAVSIKMPEVASFARLGSIATRLNEINELMQSPIPRTGVGGYKHLAAMAGGVVILSSFAASLSANSNPASGAVESAANVFSSPWTALLTDREFYRSHKDYWLGVGEDVQALLAGVDISAVELWPADFKKNKPLLTAIPNLFPLQSPEVSDFWTRWWIGARDGKPLDWELQKRVALIPAEEWEKNDPAHIAALIREIEEDFNRGTALSRAFPVDFTFAAFARLMRMVGIDDDTAHLRNPKVVRNFLDDCAEARDKLNDFIDYARELGGGVNHAGVMRLAAEKIVKELDHCRDTTHARARRLVSLGRDLERFAADEKNRGDLRESLAETLDEGLALFRNVTRKHFGPAYAALAPLTQLTLEHVDQDAAIALLDDKIGWLEGLKRNDPDFVALDAEGIAVFNDMLREARDIRAAMAEATSDEFREMLESKLAESLGGTGLALGRFVVQSAKAADKATDEFDKRARQVKTLADILKMLGFIGPAW